MDIKRLWTGTLWGILFMCVHVAYTDVCICTHHMICKMCTAVHCNDTVSTVMKDRKKTSMFPLTLNHTQTQGRLPTAFCQSTGSPARLSLGHGRLHFYPSESPSACFSSTNVTFSPQAMSLGPAVGTTGQSMASLRNPFPPNSSGRFFLRLRAIHRSISIAENGTWWLHFTPTPPVLSCQEVYFSVTRTVYLGLQPEGHSLLQVCFLVLCLHSFILETEGKCAFPAARTALGPSPAISKSTEASQVLRYTHLWFGQ